MATMVHQILKSKARNEVLTLTPQHAVIDALVLMAEQNIGAVLVMDGKNLVGIFSERDYARKGIIQGRKAKSTPLHEVMTANVHTIHPMNNIDDCMEMMSEKRVRHLPVMDSGEVIGILSVGDIVSAVINEQKAHIESLEHFITGY